MTVVYWFFSAEAGAWLNHSETCDWSFGRPGNLHPYFESKLVERELWSQASGDEHIALALFKLVGECAFMSVARGACWCFCMKLDGLLTLSLAGLDKHSPWHRNSPQIRTTGPNANVLKECKSQSRKGKELGSVYPSKLSISVSCSLFGCLIPPNCIWHETVTSSKPAPPHLPTYLSCSKSWDEESLDSSFFFSSLSPIRGLDLKQGFSEWFVAHCIRITRKMSKHTFLGSHSEALNQSLLGRSLGVWIFKVVICLFWGMLKFAQILVQP